ncbi:hypothetical protein HY504_00650 [Candidatus Wolfebacteria bacterium]|nr:hypothetical protein [Candidatus Wolfebacteria bacterium]
MAEQPFHELEVGDSFRFSGRWYMKLGPGVEANGNPVNAVAVIGPDRGQCVLFMDNTAILPSPLMTSAIPLHRLPQDEGASIPF